MYRIALHSWTLGDRSLPDLIAIAGSAGFDAVEVNWRDFDRCRDEGVRQRELAARLNDSGIEVAVVGLEPCWLFAGDGGTQLWDRIRRTADDAAGVGCRTLMSALGQASGPIGLAERNIGTISNLVDELDFSLAIEFNFGHPTFSSLRSVLNLVRSTAGGKCGLVLDSYHLHRGERPGRGFEDVEASDILHVQVSDVPAMPFQGEGSAVDRLVPGAGQVDWMGFFRLLFETGYDGTISYEAPNPIHWAADPDRTAREGLLAIRGLMARARSVSDQSPLSG